MLIKFKIDEKEREIEIKKITMKELYGELIPEIESRLKELKKPIESNASSKPDNRVVNGSTMLKDFFNSFDAGRIKSFVLNNIPYIQLKLVKHTEFSQEEIENLSLGETIDLTKKILAISFGEDVGKLLSGSRSLAQNLIMPVMKQLM